MPAPQVVLDLIERYESHREEYLSGRYNETQVRREFIDPFFESMGWDVTNLKGKGESLKEVIHEDAIKIGTGTKAPDYCFRIGGVRKFFLEAKKPSIRLRSDKEPAFQVRRYAWSANLPVSVLTNFEELVIYDCRQKPDKEDSAAKSRIKYLTYTEYVENWDYLVDNFSPDAIRRGAFDKYATTTERRGSERVDTAFLEQIEGWRFLLANEISSSNPGMSQRNLNYAVQLTLDRIIFLRICEDRGIEPYGQLQTLVGNRELYRNLVGLFHRSDQKYNSGLFHFQQEVGRKESYDDITPNLSIGSKVLSNIISALYYPDSPYEFSVLPADVLGSVYERFLGKIIIINDDSSITIEDKPIVRKSGGVFYTPTYIVNLIVDSTLEKLLDGKSVKEVAGLRIVDPACGSGSFLIAAYQHLLDWHLKQYTLKPTKKLRKELTIGKNSELKLTIHERKRILLNNIYGVDIDYQAVETTKLSLLLKVLEGETEQTLAIRLIYHERVLPDLGQNIKCGNSIIAPDFFIDNPALFASATERQRINAFDWKPEFPAVFSRENPGFDVVIGNPPWVSLSGKHGVELYTDEEINYLIDSFSGNTYMPNLYEYFIELGTRLLRDSGWFGFIVPDRFGYNSQFNELRKRMLEETSFWFLVYKAPFPQVIADTVIFTTQKTKAKKGHAVELSEYGKPVLAQPQAALLEAEGCKFEYFSDSKIPKIAAKIETAPNVARLGTLFATTSGFGGKSTLITEQRQSDAQIEVYKGDSIGRYEIRKSYWFEFVRENITGRTTDRSKLGSIEKILLRKTGNTIIATYDDSGIFPEQSLYFLFNNATGRDMFYTLAIINSKLMNFYYQNKCLTNSDSIAQVKKVDLDCLPIVVVPKGLSIQGRLADELSELAKSLLSLRKERRAAPTQGDTIPIERQIDAIQRRIDRYVYELYGLSQDEIVFIERPH